MKAIVLMGCDYDYEFVEAVFLVEDDVQESELRKQWHEECSIPYKGKNQYGEWTSTKYAKHSKQFHEWLAEKFDKVEVISI